MTTAHSEKSWSFRALTEDSEDVDELSLDEDEPEEVGSEVVLVDLDPGSSEVVEFDPEEIKKTALSARIDESLRQPGHAYRVEWQVSKMQSESVHQGLEYHLALLTLIAAFYANISTVDLEDHLSVHGSSFRLLQRNGNIDDMSIPTYIEERDGQDSDTDSDFVEGLVDSSSEDEDVIKPKDAKAACGRVRARRRVLRTRVEVAGQSIAGPNGSTGRQPTSTDDARLGDVFDQDVV